MEHTALATALAPENASQTYLAVLGGSGNVAVLHGLQRWPTATRSSINDGLLIAFEGETTKDDQPPDVWRFDEGDESLFRLQGFAEVEPSRVAKFYSTLDRVDENFFDKVCPDDTGLWISSQLCSWTTQTWGPHFGGWKTSARVSKRPSVTSLGRS